MKQKHNNGTTALYECTPTRFSGFHKCLVPCMILIDPYSISIYCASVFGYQGAKETQDNIKMLPIHSSSERFQEKDSIKAKETLHESLNTLNTYDQIKEVTLAYLLATTGVIPWS